MMNNGIKFVSAVVLSISFFLHAQCIEVGNIVQLIERDIHIPVHPAPGDNSLKDFRFLSESVGQILQIDADTTWVLFQGTSNGDDVKQGWITQHYIAKQMSGDRNPDSTSLSSDLSWCPDKPSDSPQNPNRLRIATWNIENLHAVNGESTYLAGGNRPPSVKRQDVDYERIKCYIRSFDPDILAVQEIDGVEALQRIVDTDVYNLHMSSRRTSLNGDQNTGFIYKKGLSVQVRPDYTELDIHGNQSLRYGTRIDVTVNGKTIKMMSVHMKSGCFDDARSGNSCETLMQQIGVLEAWIDKAADDEEPFIILGDFNRRFNKPGDTVWAEIDDGVPIHADLTTVTYGQSINCRDNRYPDYIDHIVFDNRAIEWVDLSSFQNVNYDYSTSSDWDKISDHCPVIIELEIEWM